MRKAWLILIVNILTSTAFAEKKCIVGKIQSKNLDLTDLVGVWYKVAHKRPVGDDPVNVQSAVFQLKLVDDDEDKLALVEYYQIANQCRGPVTGTWTKNPDNSFHVTFDSDDEGTSPFDADLKVLYQSSHPTIDDEENLVIYECRSMEKDGTCKQENQLASLLSKNRRPNTRELYQSARHLTNACIDVLQLETLDTLTECGSEILSEEHKEQRLLSSAEDTSYKDPAGMSPTKKCLVSDVPGFSLSGHSASKLRNNQFHVVAVIDPFMTKQGTSYISYTYEGASDGDATIAVYEWTRHGVCYQGYVKETVQNDSTIYTSETQYLTESGELKDLSWTAKAVWLRDNMFVTYWCEEQQPDGTCPSPRVYVWSSDQEVQQGTMFWMFRKLRSLCIDPKLLTFLNTFSDCLNAVNISAAHTFASEGVKPEPKLDPAGDAQAKEEPDTSCLVSNVRGPKTPSLFELLKGVWYFAADINGDPKIYIQSAVVRLTNGTTPNTLHVEFFAQKEIDRTCVGPGTGTVELVDEEDPTIKVRVTISKDSLPGALTNNIEWRSKVLYVDAQHALLYWCYRMKDDGTCAQHDLDILVRTRDLDREDIRTIRPVLDAACVKYDDLRWFDMHTQCGWQMRPARIHRHTYLALSHKEVLNILTVVQKPRCQRNELKGLNVDLKTFAKSGPWFLMARYDKMRFITYALVSKFDYLGRQIAIGRFFETAALPGDSKHCFERTISMSRHVNTPDDTYYRTILDVNEVESIEKATTSKRIVLKVRFLFFNTHLAVLYSCLRYDDDGKCANPLLYFLSRHETIDHHELTVLETIAKAVCINPDQLVHTSVHEKCVYDNDLSIKAIYPVKNGSCNWNQFVGEPVMLDDLTGVYHEMAIAKKSSWGIASVSSRFERLDDNKLKTTMHYSMGGQCKIAEGTYELFDEETNGFRWKTLTNGVETSMATTWYGPFRGDPYFVNIGCSSAANSGCDGTAALEHGFVAIYSRNRRQDPITLHRTYKWLADMCIDPAWLQHFNTHTSCGMEIDERTCVLTDVKGTENLDLTKLDGEWYLLAAAFDNVASTRCGVTDGGDNTKRVSCHSQANDGTCMGADVYDMRLEPNGRYNVTSVVRPSGQDVQELAAEGFVLYQDDEHVLFYGCGKTNEDGSCVSDEESVYLLSRHRSVDRDAIPEGVFTALDRVCFLSSALRYKQETACGQQAVVGA